MYTFIHKTNQRTNELINQWIVGITFHRQLCFVPVVCPQSGNPGEPEKEGKGETNLSNILNLDFSTHFIC